MNDMLVYDWIAENARRFPDKVATIDIHSGRQHSYAAMHERVARIAGHLSAIGVAKGDRVGLLSMNSSDMLDIMFACWRIGAVLTMLNFRLTAHELAFMVSDSGASAVFYDTDLEAVIPALREKTDVAHWITMDPAGKGGDLEAAIAAATPVYDQLPQLGSDLCMIMYSSGTTGTPKGVMFNHAQFLFINAGSGGISNASNRMVGLVALPLFHIGGLVAYTTISFGFGGTVVVVRAFEPGAMLRLFGDPDMGVTHFLGVPAMYNAMQAHPDFATTDFSRTQTMSCGAESVPESLLRTWFARGVPIREGYGMTETCAAALMQEARDIPGKIGAAGKPVRHCEAKIMRGDGTEAPVGELGEIWMRGLNITPGYWNRPDANASSFVDGWFRSGDVGRQDEEGYFYIEDRVKDMYITGGENVYPAEVENALYAMDAIHEVAVIGLPDPKWGECGCAVVVPRPGASVTIEDIKAYCGERLARYKHPARLEIVDALPRNATGKVLKFELRERFGGAPQPIG
ncbi:MULTISPECIES: long-chain fatty acid--CoA ligase [unclassified Sphingopyxis]|uniref:acyl-CoA synthetase n=1 Tax=unclassified Sphingopyxis TaxID=2614943 RepID=UPI0024ACB99C|nr:MULTISPECIES: long-chain fatty acid--CoA ligase [unclassified Sphingopyxis]